MTTKLLHDFKWAEEQIEEGYALSRLGWPETRLVCKAFIVTPEVEERLKQAEKDDLDLDSAYPQYMEGHDCDLVTIMAEETPQGTATDRWTASTEDKEAKDWVLWTGEEVE